MKAVNVNNRLIYPFSSRKEMLNYITDYKGLLIAMGAEKLLSDDKELIEIFNDNIVYSDGFGSVYALKRKGYTAEKIPGAQVWLDIVKENFTSKSFFLLGAKQEILDKTIEKLKKEFPSINIVGAENGYFKNEDEMISNIKESSADIVFVAMGSPKQEFFMQRAFHEHPAMYMGLGGSFDLYVGKAKPVPEWWNKYVKWEGLYRLLNDITNIKRIKRQKIVFKYLGHILKGKI